ncbi:hypothetical protein GCM10009087_51450 [Sphingomonas oligophenolica]
MTTYVARRWPIAFIGSGLSLIYGGVTWDEAVDIILEEAIDRLDRLTGPRGGTPRTLLSIELQRVTRMRRLLRATVYRAPGENLDVNEKYVALELAQEAFAVASAIDPTPGDREFRSANQVFAKLARDDSLAIQRSLVRRYQSVWTAPTPNPKNLEVIYDAQEQDRRSAVRAFEDKVLGAVAVQSFAAQFYRLDHIAKYVSPDLKADFDAIVAELVDKGIDRSAPLAIDRRGWLAPFIGAWSPADRRKAFEIARLAAEAAGDQVPEGPTRPIIDPLRKIRSQLGIRRFLTLNYDFELENLAMIPDLRDQFGRGYDIELAEKEGEVERDARLIGGQVSHSLMRRLPDGNFVASDIYRPGSAARLFEFGLNSPDRSAHIVHLHGRADHPEDLVARDDDYNRFYRRAGQGRESLERALDVTLLGNPILFVGIGLNEAEITRAFRQMVSDGRIAPDNPAFALMPLPKLSGKGTSALKGWREQAARYQLYGLHLLHYGHPRRGKDLSLPDHLYQLDLAIERAKVLRKEGLSSTADAKFKCKSASNLGILRPIAGDAGTWDWLITLLPLSGADLSTRLGLPAAEPERLPRFADGAVDFLERLRSKLYSAALEIEIEKLSAELLSVTTDLRQEIKPRILTDGGDLRWFRHRPHHVATHRHADGLIARVMRNLSAPGDARTVVVEGGAGSGKGNFLRRIQEEIPPSNYEFGELTIHLNFGIEIDSVLSTLIMFVSKVFGKGPRREDRLADLNNLLSQKTKVGKRALICLIGVERLFDNDGNPISADFLKLLEILVKRQSPEIDLLIITHPRVAATLAGFSPALKPGQYELPPASWQVGFHACLDRKIKTWLIDTQSKTWLEFEDVRRRLGMLHKSHPDRQPLDIQRINAELLTLVLDHWTALGITSVPPGIDRSRQAALELAVLDILALVGAPIEADILVHAPRIRKLLDKQNVVAADRRPKISAALHSLVTFGLAHEIASHPTGEIATVRFALHRAVLRFMRDRLGVPLGDGPLANSFSLTLAASLPLDVMVPDADIQAELRQLIGHFRSCWKDQRIIDPIASELGKLQEAAHENGSPLSAEGHQAWELIRQIERIILLRIGPSGSGLRAAANLVRSFFSASSLVTTDSVADSGNPGRLPEFEAHKRRIQDVFIRIREWQNVERNFKDLNGKLTKEMKGASAKAASRRLGAAFKKLCIDEPAQPPLFGAEIVWLHNERGVVAMLQGDLYEAEFSLNNAREANRLYKGAENRDGPFHNFSRIDVNRTLLLIERGRLRDAEVLLKRIHEQLGHGVDSERKLIAPLVTGYRGLVAHLKGHATLARNLYTESIDELQVSEQQRALGLFLIRRATLWRVLQEPVKCDNDVQRAVLAAEAGRQIDLLWRARLVRRMPPEKSGEQERIATKALAYGEATGLLRVELEALLGLIAIDEDRKNYERAMQLTARAMIVALRSGAVLRRIGLRVIMGRLMLLSGDPAGEYLLRRAIEHADLIGYGAAVERAQQALNANLTP